MANNGYEKDATARLEKIFEGGEKWFENELMPALKEESPRPLGAQQLSDDEVVARWDHDVQAPYGRFAERLKEHMQLNPDMDEKRAFIDMVKAMARAKRMSEERRRKEDGDDGYIPD